MFTMLNSDEAWKLLGFNWMPIHTASFDVSIPSAYRQLMVIRALGCDMHLPNETLITGILRVEYITDIYGDVYLHTNVRSHVSWVWVYRCGRRVRARA